MGVSGEFSVALPMSVPIRVSSAEHVVASHGAIERPLASRGFPSGDQRAGLRVAGCVAKPSCYDTEKAFWTCVF